MTCSKRILWSLTGCAIASLLAVSCNTGTVVPREDPLARVHDRFLYLSDLKGLTAEDLPPEDSAALVADFIDTWVKQQLILEVATNNLPEKLAIIEKQAAEYRESLLIDAYLQNWVDQNLDTAISLQEVQAFFDQQRGQFMLEHDVYRLDYIVVEAGVVNYDSLTYWFRNAERFRETIDRFCALYCLNYFLDSDRWYGPDDLRRNFPGADFDAAVLESDAPFDVRNQDRVFLMRVRERRRSGEPGPLAYFQTEIENRILNRRRRELIKQTYRNLYVEGGKREQFEIFTP